MECNIFWQLIIENSNFSNVNFEEVNMTSSTIENSNFVKANFNLGKMYGVIIKSSVLDEAIMTNVNIQKSILSKSSFITIFSIFKDRGIPEYLKSI